LDLLWAPRKSFHRAAGGLRKCFNCDVFFFFGLEPWPLVCRTIRAGSYALLTGGAQSGASTFVTGARLTPLFTYGLFLVEVFFVIPIPRLLDMLGGNLLPLVTVATRRCRMGPCPCIGETLGMRISHVTLFFSFFFFSFFFSLFFFFFIPASIFFFFFFCSVSSFFIVIFFFFL